MDFSSALSKKQFFRFTGPPEHWLTAIKYMTWGLEESYMARWQGIRTGDVFFIHSTKASAFPNAKSGIIGIGVVGFNFSIKNEPLWHYEVSNNVNRWPLLIPLTELYLFGEVPNPLSWESPVPTNDAQTSHLIDQLLESRVPISQIHGFPPMGSFSSVSDDVAKQILTLEQPLHVYSGHSTRGVVSENRPSDLSEVLNATETLRSAASLRFLDSIKKRLILKPYSLVVRDNDILARAETSHHSVLDQLITIFRAKGYDTLSNEFVDLFAHDGNRSFLIEVKSTENRNFRVQARKGIAQLLEYDYFDISKFKKERNLDFKDQYRILVTSKEPRDEKYIDFMNSLDLGVGVVDKGSLKPIGTDLGFSVI